MAPFVLFKFEKFHFYFFFKSKALNIQQSIFTAATPKHPFIDLLDNKKKKDKITTTTAVAT